MVKLFIFIGTTIGSYLGWWLGDLISGDIMFSFLMSSVGAAAGIIIGWKLAKNME